MYQQVTPEERKRHDVTSYIFDDLGRMVSRREPDLVSTWIFDNGSDCSPATRHSCGQLVEANTMAGGSKDYVRTLDYDGVGRLRTTTLALDSLYTSTSEYDNWGRLLRQRYQREGGAEKVFDYRYNGYGYLARIERGKLALWTATAQDASQRVTAALLGNGTSVSRDYNPYNGLISNAVLTDAAQRPLLIESYHYDPLQNVEQRGVSWDNAGFTESFGYDNLNRLKTSTIGDAVSTFTYNEIGNIVSKTGVGTGNYVYPANGEPLPHAVMGIPGIGSFNYDDDGNMTGGAGRTARWTSFDMLDMIGKGDDWSIFIYGPEHQRIRQDKADGSRIYYAGAMEVEFASNGAAKVKTYWPAGLGLETEDASGTHLLWTHEDRQGSVIAITGEDGAVKERMIYDSWGKRRELDDATTPDSIDGVTDNKGYTGHEMLDNVDLVHMNGRVYDAFIARFMSADPYVQDAHSSQSYNRYSYVWNNPVNLTDPTGFIANGANNSPFADWFMSLSERIVPNQKNTERLAAVLNSADARVEIKGHRICKPCEEAAWEAYKRFHEFTTHARGAARTVVRMVPGWAAATAFRATVVIGVLVTPGNIFQKNTEDEDIARIHAMAAEAEKDAESLSGDKNDGTTHDPADILTPDGKPVGEVAGGATDDVRTVSPDELDEIADRLKGTGAKLNPEKKYPGEWYDLPDGKSGFGIRDSRKSGKTIDINIPGVPDVTKIHQR